VVALDCETSGFSAARGHRVIEIGAVKLVAGGVTAEFHSLIDAGCPIHREAQRVHGISREDLHGQPSPPEVFARFRDFIGPALLVAHNAPFDMAFLRSEFARLGWHLSNRSRCTLRLSRRLLPDLPDHRLETVARHLLGEMDESERLHRALADARLAARVWTAFGKL
jgi:DNA polymerase III epsilon subunit family exonuclease